MAEVGQERVYFWDHEREDTDCTVLLIADCLDEFMGSLRDAGDWDDGPFRERTRLDTHTVSPMTDRSIGPPTRIGTEPTRTAARMRSCQVASGPIMFPPSCRQFLRQVPFSSRHGTSHG
ncbi:hypothetical protein Stsp02_27080 [Streptomyces sp. NBRC 14336]|nr:hypothetical protein Stsp02_27080 [Streptomyces sp. NBRC 14336]